MADDNNGSDKKPSIFSKMYEAGMATLESQIQKARQSTVMNDAEAPEDFVYAKAMTEDPNYANFSQGWKEKYHRLTNTHLRQMATKDTGVIAIIKTFQNKAAAHAKLVKSDQERGFIIKIKDEEALLEEIKEKLREEMGVNEESPGDSQEVEKSNILSKAEGEVDESDTNMNEQDSEDQAKNQMEDDEVEEYDFELDRKARAKLEDMFKKDIKKVQDWVIHCGILDKEKRPFELRGWNFEQSIRAWVWDSLTYDLYAREMVPDKAGRPCYWYPVDGGTIKFASSDLKNYKDRVIQFTNHDFLYPEKHLVAQAKQEKLDLDEELLEKEAYRYVQVVRGKIERAYTDDELAVGIRNKVTDIFQNGYGISELELAIGLVTGHLNAEFYNQAYFTQGFSAKGILHIKAALNRRKLETVRQQWQHMLKGSRNSFQTPIFAGVNDIQWIPLTQNHQDIGFEGWMRYLIKMLCAVYQIDPNEVGINLREEGKGGGLGGDDTEVRLSESKERGMFPLMTHLQNFINEKIIKPFDDRFELCFTGITSETQQQTLDRQQKEVKFKKTVNEIRKEDGLPPLPGMDDIILDPTYMQWYTMFSSKAKEVGPQMGGSGAPPAGEALGEEESMETDVEPMEFNLGDAGEQVEKSMPIIIEHYLTKNKKDDK